MWNYKCLHCGARLDPGEKCDCQDERQRYLRQFIFGGMNDEKKHNNISQRV